MHIQRKTGQNRALLIVIGTLLILLLACTLPVFSADDPIEGDYIRIGDDIYMITQNGSVNVPLLVDADLAFLRNQSLGSEALPVYGVFNGERVDGQAAVYDKIYALLLENPTKKITSGSQLSAVTVSTDVTQIYVLENDITMTGYAEVIFSGRLIFVSSKAVTITLGTTGSGANRTAGRFNVGYTTAADDRCVLAFQGRDENSQVSICGDGTTRPTTPVFRMLNGGSLFLNYTELKNFKMGSTETGDALIYFSDCLPSTVAINAKRCLYMTNSSMHDIEGGKSPGIFLKAYFASSASGVNERNKLCELNLYKNKFYNCVIVAGSSYAGGPVIRSFAADNCKLRMESCELYNNSNNSTGTACGGGAIYWKSAAGNAEIIDCEFRNNTSATVGGAIFNTGNMTIENCKFYDNEAGEGGGAIAAEPPRTGETFGNINKENLKGTLTLDSKTVLSDNSTNGKGGAIYFNAITGDNGPVDIDPTNREKYEIHTYEMQLIVDGATIERNSAHEGGGVAMWLDFKEHDYTTGITIKAGSKVQNNYADSGNGGAIWMGSNQGCWCKNNANDISGVTMLGGELLNNSAQNGGAIYIATGDSTATMNFNLNGGSVQNNRATNHGGAAYIAGGNFTMSGGDMQSCYAQNGEGGAIYLASGLFTISNGDISNCEAQQGSGGASYIQGGNFTMSGGAISACTASENGGAVCVEGGEFTLDGTGRIEALSAQNGGAVYVSGGDAIMYGGTITSYAAAQGQTTIPALATNGGAVCVNGGSFTISAGTIEKTVATNGGAVYVSDGNANVHGGTLTACTAQTGGAIYVQGGTVTMLGGEITNNKATEGNGGAIYVTGNSDLSVIVQSGTISGNSAAGKGGAISVEGAGNIEVTVQIGVNDLHYNSDGTEAIPPCDHNKNTKNDEENLEGNGYCPIVRDNTCASEGGAIYITGSTSTNLNIYCIEESDNRCAGNPANSDKTSLSDFLKVDGGKVLISATDAGGNVYYGNSVINSSIHVTGGDLTVKGTMTNPAIFAPITVDVVASGGSYNDFRKNDDNTDDKYYVIRYFENFKQTDANGQETTTGQYTVHQALRSQPHTVWGVIYSHTGKTIVGWNTKQDGKGKEFGVSSVVQYQEIVHLLQNETTLELYAIWAENFYWIKFDPNTSSYTGSMEDQSFLCAAQNAPLPENKFVNRGYKFLGWSLSASTTEIGEYDYLDQALLETALTQKVGEVITLYAVWRICDHADSSKFVFEQGASTDSMTCTCQCTYVVTATIVPPAGKVTYDEGSHPARIVYTNDNGGSFTQEKISQFTNLTISYVYKTVSEETVSSDTSINAGDYTATATISETDIKVSVTFTIARAPQTAPSKPTFTASGNTLTIDTPTKVIGDAGLAVLYKLVHTVEGVPVEKGPQESRVFQEFDDSWTLYYVAAYYPGNDNYLQSEVITSDQKYLFEGGVHITVVDEYGIKTELVKPSEGEPSFVSNPLVGYYISRGYKATITVTDKDGNVLSEADQNTIFNAHFIRNPVDKIFSYLINPFENNSSYNITITFEGAKLEPTVDASVAPNEQFGNVTDVANTVIGKDSAFTAYFEVENFDTEVYSDLTLKFTQTLPAGTTVIMVDKSSGSYWYATVGEGGEDTIAISSFKQMGVGSGSPTIGATLKYQFIVDFSDIDQNALINAASLGVELTATVGGSEVGYAPDLPTTGKTITLDNVTHSLGDPSVDGNSATMDMNYAQGAANASKWTDREVVLVLTPSAPSQLPIDASIMVIETVGSQTKTTIVTINDRDEFVIPLDRNATKLKIVLQSQMFAKATYVFTATLYAAYEADAPMNGIDLIAGEKTITLTTVPKAQNAAKITVPDNKRIFKLLDTETISGKVDVQLSPGYISTITLLHKDVNGYVSTAWSMDLSNGENPFEISNLKSAFKTGGSFCLLVVIRDSSSTAVLEVPYYLIIQE